MVYKQNNDLLFYVLGAVLVVVVLGALYYYTREKQSLIVTKSGEPNKGTILLVHSPHCGHCKAMMNDWREFKAANADKVVIKEIDGSTNQKATQSLGVRGFPTILWLPGGLNTSEGAVVYQGDRSSADIEKFARKHAY